MLVISKKSWHWRVYQHWKKKISRKPPETVNLCHYMRAVLIYTPAFYAGVGIVLIFAGICILLTSPIWGSIWLINRRSDALRKWWAWVEDVSHAHERFLWIAFGSLFCGLFIVWMVAISWHRWWVGPTVILGIIAGMAGAVGFALLAEQIRERRMARLHRRSVQTVYEPRPSTTGSLLWAWIKATKKKMCPIITTSGGSSAGRAPGR